eukprot:COSAG01_NODE_2425_length_7679_cov_96.031221_11_plen_69_part_00
MGQSGAIAAVLIGVLVTSDTYSSQRGRATVLPQDLSHEPPWRGPAEQTGLNRARSQLSPDWARIPLIG